MGWCSDNRLHKKKEKRHRHGWISIVERSHILIPLNPLPLRLFEAIVCESEIKLKIWRALTTCCAKGSPASCWETVPTLHYWVPHLLLHQQPNATISTALSSVAFFRSQMVLHAYHFSCSDIHSHPRGGSVITSRQPTPNVQLQGPTHHLHRLNVCVLMLRQLNSSLLHWCH